MLLFCLSAVLSQDEGARVRFQGIGPWGGDVRSLLIDYQHPNVVFLGTSSGKIFRSSDRGRSWTLLSPGLGNREFVIDTLVQHPKDPDHIYAGCWDLHSDGGGLFESRDSGESWKQIVLPQISSAVRGLAICRKDPIHMIVGTLSGVYLSSDGGHSWKKTGGMELEKAESVGIDPADCRYLYVGTWRLGYRSIDSGKHWIRVTRGMPLDSDVFSISIHDGEPKVLYASACSGVYRSNDRAFSWTRLRVLADRFTVRARVVQIDPLEHNKIYAGTTEGLFLSKDEGKTWRRLTRSNIVVNAMQIDPSDTRRLLVGTEYQGVLLSEDGGETWRESNAGFVHQQIAWITPDSSMPGAFWAGIQSGAGGLSFYDLKDGAWSSTQISSGARIGSFLILPENRGKLAGTSQGVYWLPKDSERWRKLSGSIAQRPIYSLEFDPLSSVLYAGTDQGIYVTPLSTLQFRVPPGNRFSSTVWCTTASKTIAGLVYAGSSIGVLRSFDKGTTWNVISTYGLPERSIIETLSLSPGRHPKLWAGTSAGLFSSQDGGIHWTRAGAGMMAVDIPSVLFLDNSGLRMAAADKNSGGVFYSQDGGESWVKLFSPEYQSPVYCLSRIDGQASEVLAGTRSEGIYRIQIGALQNLP